MKELSTSWESFNSSLPYKVATWAWMAESKRQPSGRTRHQNRHLNFPGSLMLIKAISFPCPCSAVNQTWSLHHFL